MIVERIRADLTAAMKAQDKVTTGTLRMLLAKVREAEVAGREARTLDDAGVLAVINREVKARDEAIEAFAAAGRHERVAAERAKREVLVRYLPEPLSNAELESIVRDEIAAAGLQGPRDMGAAMKLVNAKVAGRADGRTVSSLVRDELARRAGG